MEKRLTVGSTLDEGSSEQPQQPISGFVKVTSSFNSNSSATSSSSFSSSGLTASCVPARRIEITGGIITTILIKQINDTYQRITDLQYKYNKCETVSDECITTTSNTVCLALNYSRPFVEILLQILAGSLNVIYVD